MLLVTCHGDIQQVLCTVKYGLAQAAASERNGALLDLRPCDTCVPNLPCLFFFF